MDRYLELKKNLKILNESNLYQTKHQEFYLSYVIEQIKGIFKKEYYDNLVYMSLFNKFKKEFEIKYNYKFTLEQAQFIDDTCESISLILGGKLTFKAILQSV